MPAADISTYDPTLSVIDDDEAKEDFHKHIKMYFDRLKADDNGSHSTIHYLPTPKKPDTYLAPTIVPTSLNFQNYPFVLTGWSQGGEKNNDNNMLIYLQMVCRLRLWKTNMFELTMHRRRRTEIFLPTSYQPLL